MTTPPAQADGFVKTVYVHSQKWCTIVCGVTIGQYAFIGAWAVVVKDVPDFALVVGNPGRIIGWMCQCGNRLNWEKGEKSGVCRACQRIYRKEGQKVSPKYSG